MRSVILVSLFILIVLNSVAQDSLLVRIMVRPPGNGAPAKNAIVLLDGREAVYNRMTMNYELNAPCNQLVQIEVRLKDAETARFRFYSRHWKHSNEQLYVRLGKKGCRYMRSVSNNIIATWPDTLRIGIADDKGVKPVRPLDQLLDSLELVADTAWKFNRYPPASRTYYPYLAYRKKNDQSFGSSGSEIKLLKQNGYKVGVFFDTPQSGLHVTSPWTVTVHRDVKTEEVMELFDKLGFREIAFDNGSKFTLLPADEGLGTGILDLMNALMDSGLVDTISYPGYSGVSLH